MGCISYACQHSGPAVSPMDTGMGTRSDGSGVGKVCELGPTVTLLTSVDHGQQYMMEAGFFPSGTVPTCLVAEGHYVALFTGSDRDTWLWAGRESVLLCDAAGPGLWLLRPSWGTLRNTWSRCQDGPCSRKPMFLTQQAV